MNYKMIQQSEPCQDSHVYAEPISTPSIAVKCDNSNCIQNLQTFQRKNLLRAPHNFKRLAKPESIKCKFTTSNTCVA